MIDLETKNLCHEIRCGNEWVEIETDFRVWLRFSRYLTGQQVYTGIFKSEVPEGAWLEGALEFLNDENPCPKRSGNKAKVFDWLIDSDYLLGAFWQTYGINLTEINLHWHVFLALFRALPDGTKLSEIMSYRAWTDSDKKSKEVYRKLRSKWALPNELNEYDEIIRWQQEFFGVNNG